MADEFEFLDETASDIVEDDVIFNDPSDNTDDLSDIEKEHGKGASLDEATGNIVSKDGSIIKEGKKSESSKEKEEKEEKEEKDPDASSPDGLFEELNTLTGIDLPPDATFEDTNKGVAEWGTSLYTKGGEEAINALYQQHPYIKEQIDFVSKGGNIEEYFKANQQNTFSGVALNKEDTSDAQKATQKEVITSFYKSKGLDDVAIKTLISSFETSETLYDNAAKAQTVMKEESAAAVEELKARQAAAYEEELKTTTKYWNNIKSEIDTGKVAGLVIPAADRAPLFEYLSKAVDDNGNNQLAVALQDKETMIKVALLVMKGFDVTKLIAEKKESSFADRLSKSAKEAEKKKGGNGRNTSRVSFDESLD